LAKVRTRPGWPGRTTTPTPNTTNWAGRFIDDLIRFGGKDIETRWVRPARCGPLNVLIVHGDWPPADPSAAFSFGELRMEFPDGKMTVSGNQSDGWTIGLGEPGTYAVQVRSYEEPSGLADVVIRLAARQAARATVVMVNQ
jgi:hypothetical protein